uniref:Holin n=1 Tax=Gordonia phage Petito TaxID=3158876 RepID=A0AAU8GPN8_9CAUD
MLNLNTIKLVTSTIVGLGTTKIVTTIIKNNVDPQTAVDAVTITAGSFVIGGMVADASKQYTDKTIDNIADAIKSLKKAPAEEN